MATIMAYLHVQDIAREMAGDAEAIAELINTVGELRRLTSGDVSELVEALSDEGQALIEMLGQAIQDRS